LEEDEKRFGGDSWSHDVSINKPFKNYVTEEYNNWLHRDDLPLTASGTLKKPSASEVARRVSNAWTKIPSELVRKSFKKCCVTNALDGTEEDVIWENSTERESDDHSSDNSSSDGDDEKTFFL